jgi:hypothetical protein
MWRLRFSGPPRSARSSLNRCPAPTFYAGPHRLGAEGRLGLQLRLRRRRATRSMRSVCRQSVLSLSPHPIPSPLPLPLSPPTPNATNLDFFPALTPPPTPTARPSRPRRRGAWRPFCPPSPGSLVWAGRPRARKGSPTPSHGRALRQGPEAELRLRGWKRSIHIVRAPERLWSVWGECAGRDAAVSVARARAGPQGAGRAGGRRLRERFLLTRRRARALRCCRPVRRKTWAAGSPRRAPDWGALGRRC